MRTLAKCLAAVAAMSCVLAFAPAASAEDSDPFESLVNQALSAAHNLVTDLKLKATFYRSGVNGVGRRDSLGCAVVPMRTLAVDPSVIPKRAVVFIKETVGMILPDGSIHDGLWYASDTGGSVKGNLIDMFTGGSTKSQVQLGKLNTSTLNAAVVGSFKGCPPK